MTIQDAISQIDTLRANQYSQVEKIRWLSDLDWQIKREIFDTHEGTGTEFVGYTADTDMTTELLAPEPYEQVYRWYLEAQIDKSNSELTKYNNSMSLFNTAYLALQDYINRTYMPKVNARNISFTGRKPYVFTPLD